MPRSYRHIKEYESEILKLKEQGHTQREIAEKFGFSKEQIKGLLKRKRKRDEKQRRLTRLYSVLQTSLTSVMPAKPQSLLVC